MKKTFVKLAAVTALAGVVAPLATVQANNPFATVNSKVNPAIAQLGKVASEKQVLRNIANEAHIVASQKVIYFQNAAEVTAAKLRDAKAAYEAKVAEAKKAIADNEAARVRALGELESGTVAPGEDQKSAPAGAQDLSVQKATINDFYNVQGYALEEALNAAIKDTAAVEVAQVEHDTELKNIEEAKKVQAEALANLQKAQAEYEAALGQVRSVSPEAAQAIENNQPAPAGSGQAGATPAGTQSPNKKAATNVAAAKTATASKALPKTSAVK